RLWRAVPGHFTYRRPLSLRMGRPTTPTGQSPPVWAVPRSLAATEGIAVAFFSSGYPDVSVPLVCPRPPYGFRWRYRPSSDRWVAPFGNPRIDARLQLPERARRSTRP